MSSWLLSTDGAHPVRLDVVADEARDLTISPEQVRVNVAGMPGPSVTGQLWRSAFSQISAT